MAALLSAFGSHAMWVSMAVLVFTILGPGLAMAKVKHFTYEVLEERQHPPDHFTQGFMFRLSDGALVEGTGISGQSVLAVYGSTDSGSPSKPQKRVPLPNNHFGEGIAEYLGKIYQLTWQEGKVHVWDSASLKHLETRTMPHLMTEGWGLCTSPGHDALIMSDGSARLFWVVPDANEDGGFLLRKEVLVKDCENFREIMRSGGLIGGMNELESVPLRVTHPEEARALHTTQGAPNFENAKPRPSPMGANVFANIYGTKCVAVIEPSQGNVKAYIHLDGLNPNAGFHDKVTNGIAYRDLDESLWVTGKNWDKMFRIRLKELDKPPANFPYKCVTSWNPPLGVPPKEPYPSNICASTRRTTDKIDL